MLAMEANPPIYNTNYINTDSEAFALVKKIDSKGFLVNLDPVSYTHLDVYKRQVY